MAKQPQTPSYAPDNPPPLTPATSTPASTATPISTPAAQGVAQQTFFSKVPNWGWVALAVLVILLLIMRSPPSKRRAEYKPEVIATLPSSIPPEASSSVGNVPHNARPDEALDNLPHQPSQPPEGFDKVNPRSLAGSSQNKRWSATSSTPEFGRPRHPLKVTRDRALAQPRQGTSSSRPIS